MLLNDGEFKADEKDGAFEISITQESDHSSDGGYTFETVTNTYKLGLAEAKALSEELLFYIDNMF